MSEGVLRRARTVTQTDCPPTSFSVEVSRLTRMLNTENNQTSRPTSLFLLICCSQVC